MASRRGTNNSTVVSLDQQTAVIEEISTLAGLRSSSVMSPIEDSAVRANKGEKEKKKRKAKAAQAGTADPQGPVKAAVRNPQGPRSAGFYQGPSRAASVPGPSETEAEGGPVQGQGRQLDDVPGNQPDNEVIDRSGSVDQQDGDEEVEPEDDLERQQQWWLWDQWQRFGQPSAQSPFSPYGNYVPNFAFGMLPQAPEWAAGGDNAAGPPTARARQATHEMSEDEEEEIMVIDRPVTQSQQTVKGPESKSETLLKEQLGSVKEADRVSQAASDEVARLLDRYLKDATAVAEMEKLVKLYPRIANLEGMKVQRLDGEIFQAVEQGVKNTDQSFQGVQKAILAAMTAFTPVLRLSSCLSSSSSCLRWGSKGFLEGSATSSPVRVLPRGGLTTTSR